MEIKTLAIIVPVYNTASYLHEFIKGLDSQNRLDFDAYFVDDGSTDDSLRVLKAYEKKDHRFKIFTKDNGGVSSARNLALEAIQSSKYKYKYIYFCDSDDWLDSSALTKVIGAMEEAGADYGLFSVRKVYKDKVLSAKKNIKNNLLMNHDDILKQYFRYTLKWRKEPSSEAFLNNKIFKASIILNFRFDESLIRSEDFEYFMRVSKHLEKGILVPDAWFNYRMRKSSLTHCGYRPGDIDACLKLYEQKERFSKLEKMLLQHKLFRAIYLELFQTDDIERFLHIAREVGFSKPLMLKDVKLVFLIFTAPKCIISMVKKIRNIIKIDCKDYVLFD